MTRGRRRIEQLLRQHPGQFFCVGCLGFALRVGFEELLSALGSLDGLPWFESLMDRCSNCRQVGRVVRVRGERGRRSRMAATPAARAAVALRRQAGSTLCDACLALAADVSLDDVRTALARLTGRQGMVRAEGRCERCQRSGAVTCAHATDDAEGATGDVNAHSGSYLSACCGGRIRLGRGSPFPTCRWCLDATTWVRVARQSA
ncbi:MAG TPA: hypothetical protein VNN07_13950 [Candidatus Tectomicrobia bacterium]|nr:hypothetical protein [Candidatus Tectomicrobia bacterium]